MPIGNELIIGLGGVGGRAIAQFRKIYEMHTQDQEILRNKNYRFEYLYIDSNNDILSSNIWAHAGREYALEPNSIVQLKANGNGNLSLDDIAAKDNIKLWIGNLSGQFISRSGLDENDVPSIVGMDGAGQLRRLGRALFAMSANTVRTVLKNKISTLTQGTTETAVNVRIFCTLGGGTGSGSLIDTVVMLQELGRVLHKQIHTYVYPFIAGEAADASNSGSFYENEYATLRDLNALMVRTLRPHRVDHSASAEGTQRFVHNANFPAIKAVCISSELAPCDPTLDDQLYHITSACLDSIVYSNSFSSATAYRAISGEDLVQTAPGEPAKAPRRSYRFTALGAKRWSVPTALIKELLVLDHSIRIMDAQLVGTNTAISRDLSTLTAPSSPKGTETWETMEKICATTSQPLRKLENELQNKVVRDVDILHEIREKALSIAESLAAAGADHATKAGLQQHYDKDSKTMMETLETACNLKLKWQGYRTEAWGLEDIKSYLTSYRAQVANWSKDYFPLQNREKSEEEVRRILANMDRRAAEWMKLGILSHHFTSKGRRMIQDQIQDALTLIDLKLNSFRNAVITSFAATYGQRVQRLQESVNKAIERITKRRGDLEIERNKIQAGLYSDGENKDSDVSDIYEFDRTNLTNMRLSIADDVQTFETQMADTYSPMWETYILSIANYTDNRYSEYCAAISGSLLPDVTNAVNRSLEQHPSLQNVLAGTILDYLGERSGTTEREWEQALGDKVRRFVAKMRQSSTIQGEGLKTPQVSPAKALMFGFPSNIGKNAPLRDWLKKKIRASIPANSVPDRSYIDFYEHNTSDEIRALCVNFWMPARFADVVSHVYDKYEASAKDVENSQKVYFANIDDIDINLDSDYRPALTQQGDPDELMAVKVAFCKHLVLHTEPKTDEDTPATYPVLTETETQIMVATSLFDGIPEFETFSSANKKYPSEPFRTAVNKAIQLALQSMLNEEKEAIYNKYHKEARKAAEIQPGDDAASQKATKKAEELKEAAKNVKAWLKLM